jgi:O-antigen ligase
MKKTVVAAAYGAWLFLVIVVFYAFRGENENALQLVVLGGVLPVGLQLVLLGVDTRGLVAPTKISLAFTAIIVFSYFANAWDWMPIIYTINTVYIFVVAIIVAGSPDRDLLRAVAGIFSILTAVFLVFVCYTGEYVWGRLSANNIQPNFWGLMGLAVIASAFALRLTVLRLACLAAGFLTIYNASARGSLVAALAALAAVVILTLLELRNHRLIAAVAAASVALVVAASVAPLIADRFESAASDVLKLEDPDRGVGQGFTGRSAGWVETYELWTKSPFFGVGFRQHEALLTTNTSAHNAYLAMLADTGLFGLVLYVGLLVSAALAALQITDRPTRNLIVATVLGYAVIGFFERRAINSGNPYGILILMCAYYVMAYRQRRMAFFAQQRQSAHGDEMIAVT